MSPEVDADDSVDVLDTFGLETRFSSRIEYLLKKITYLEKINIFIKPQGIT